MAQCTAKATKQISLGGNPPKFACDKHFKRVKAFANQFKTKLDVRKLEPFEEHQCEEDV
jgi:hypothetical protein